MQAALEIAKRDDVRAIAKRSSSEIYEIDLDLLVDMDDFKPRSVIPNIEEMAASLESNGQKEPGLVIAIKNNGEVKFGIIKGYRRVAGLRYNAERGIIQKFRATLADSKSTEQDWILDELTTQQACKLQPAEEAKLIEKLATKYNMKQAEIAKRIGRSQVYVSDAIKLIRVMNESPAVKEMIETGSQSKTEIVKIARKRSTRLAAEIITSQAKDGGKVKAAPKETNIPETEPLQLDEDRYMACSEEICTTFNIPSINAIAGIIKKHF